MAVPMAPGRWPVLGHTPAPPRHRFGFAQGLQLTHEALVAASAKFRKDAMFDKFRPFVGNGSVNSEAAFHLRQRRLAFHRERIARYTETMRTAVGALSDFWRAGEITSTAYPSRLSMTATLC
jgi:cytochrome P450